MSETYIIEKRSTPIIAAAIHDGHTIFPNFISQMMLQEHERFREEDPYTAFMAQLPTSRILVGTSRFQVDLNRPPEKAIYKHPEDAWGLSVWRQLTGDDESFIMDYYHRFYNEVKTLLEETLDKYGYFLILDIHSYNHRRDSPYVNAPAERHPEINLGTAYNRPKWRPLLNHLCAYLTESSANGVPVDVRENIIFKGGAFAQWAIKHYGNQGCVVSLEFKKTFMDEWTGRANFAALHQIRKTLRGALPLLYADLKMLHTYDGDQSKTDQSNTR